MKKLLLVFVFITPIIKAEKLPLIEQLIALNSNWQFKTLPPDIKDSSTQQLDDVTLIRLHFKLVEAELSTKAVKNLTAAQKENRQRSLARLHTYAERGVFPKNYHFNYRRPVFIDEHGSYCAVGELIKESGNDAFAQKVHHENNFGYISDLNKQYEALGAWAEENGFTTDELAWIQPCYGSTCADTVGLVHPSCYKGVNGYFRPDYVTFKSIKNRKLYKLIDTTWSTWSTDICGGFEPCYLVAGQYKWEVTDSVDIVHTFSATLVAPDSAVVTILQLGDFNACNGTIVVTPNGGAPPFRYRWQNETSYTKDSIRSGFCEQPVKITVIESRHIFCDQIFEFHTGTLGVNTGTIDNLLLAPNPVIDRLTLTGVTAATAIGIYNTIAQRVYFAVLSGNTEIDLSSLNSGVYYFEISRGEHKQRGKLIKR